jgi:hypothetical protein
MSASCGCPNKSARNQQAGWSNFRDASGPQCFGSLWPGVSFWRHA